MVDTKDMPTEHGCEMYKGSQPGVDASAVATCRASGAAIIGKTVSHPHRRCRISLLRVS